MRISRVLVVACTALSAGVLANEITVEQIAEDEFVLTLNSTEHHDLETSQYVLVPKAMELCGNLTPSFGRYSFENVETLAGDAESTVEPSYRFSQEVSCEEPGASVQEEKAQGSFKRATDSQIEKSVRKVTNEYFESLYVGKFEMAYAQLTESMQSFKSFSDWKATHEEFYQSAGDLNSRTVWRVTIYDNPPQAPRPGLYVATDYFNSYENTPLHCGYLIWYSDGESEYRIIREETGHLTNDVMGEMSGDQLEQVKTQFGCSAR